MIKLLIYLLGLISGLILSYVFFVPEAAPALSTSKVISSISAKQLVDGLNLKNSALIQQADDLTEGYAMLKQDNDNLEARLNIYLTKEKDEGNLKSARREERIRSEVETLKAILSLTPAQIQKITELKREEYSYHDIYADGKIDNPLPNLEEDIKFSLTDEQLVVYEQHEIHEDNGRAETSATMYLRMYPVTANLSEEQKDIIYQNLYEFDHPETNFSFYNRFSDSEDNEFELQEQRLIWAAEDVLTEAQMEILIQSL